MAYEFIKTKLHGSTEVLSLNDPSTLNAVNFTMMEEMETELLKIAENPSIRVLILTGEGRGFCSGANIKEMASKGGAKEVEAQAPSIYDINPHLTFTRGVIYNLWKLPKPTIAAINGPCITTGVGLSAACDFRVASDQAKIGWVFLRRGLVPDEGSLGLLVKLLGYQTTYKLGILGELISPDEALNIGLIDTIVPQNELIDHCLSLAEKISKAGPPLAQQMFKKICNESQYSSYEETSRQAHLAFESLTRTKDHKESVRAFAEKRDPIWTGE